MTATLAMVSTNRIECTVHWAEPVRNPTRFIDWLDAAERARFEAYRQEADRCRFLTARVVAKSAVGEWLNASPRSVSLDATCADCGKQHGPPRVPGASVKLSISHSAKRVVAAVTGGAPVGIDVEATTRKVDRSLIEYALNDDELANLNQLSPTNQSTAFFTYWVRKEALMKSTGRGLRTPLRDLTVSAHDSQPQLLASADESLSPTSTSLMDLSPGVDYRAAVAVLTSSQVTVMEQWSQP